MRLTVDSIECVTFDKPEDPPDPATRTQVQIWEKEVDEFIKHCGYFKENLKTLYSLVWGQCTDVMRQKIEAADGFEDIFNQGDGLGLLQAIKDTVYQFHSQKVPTSCPSQIHAAILHVFCKENT